MSIKFAFKDDKFSLDKLQLPSRHYHFDDNENYIKLLNIGEGIFPKDKIRTSLILDNSNLILTTESATKIYPSKKEYGIQKIDIFLKNNSNLEFINDELILYKDSKYIQFFNLKSDENSTFFYTDILSRGRSFEDFDFSNKELIIKVLKEEIDNDNLPYLFTLGELIRKYQYIKSLYSIDSEIYNYLIYSYLYMKMGMGDYIGAEELVNNLLAGQIKLVHISDISSDIEFEFNYLVADLLHLQNKYTNFY